MATPSHNMTLFLTTGEVERIRQTFQDRLQKCLQLKGQPRVAGNTKSHLNQIGTVSLLADLSEVPEKKKGARKSTPDAITAFIVGQPYPPCTLSLQDLQPMNLAELCMETHHRGRVLTVRRVAPVVKLVAFSWTIVQEESSGQTERLEMLLHKSNHGQEILESGYNFEVKEPYFTLTDLGDPTLRIDHPSDLVVRAEDIQTYFSGSLVNQVESSESSISAIGGTSFQSKTAMMYKEKGNTALAANDLLEAHAHYSQGLQLVSINGTAKEEPARDLFRNRAYVNLALNRLDEANDDALASLTSPGDQKSKDLDSKAYFRAGCAAYNLGEFQKAKQYFEEQLRLGDVNATASLRRTDLRIEEQTTGLYNFAKIKADVFLGRPRVDAASFTVNTKVGESPGRGRGLFATRSLDSGQIIMCEKSFGVVWGNDDEASTALTYDSRDDGIRVFPVGLCRAIVEKLRNNPSQVNRVMDLYSDYRGIDKQPMFEEPGPLVDTFQVYDIVARNAFGPGPVRSTRQSGREEVGDASAGIWISASYMNHSCIPNAVNEYIGDLMILRSTRPINAGEEITHSYDDSTDYDVRASALMNTWGFKCTCALCIAEEADSPDLRKKRRDLESEANAFLEREEALGAKRLSIIRAQRLVRVINNTYDDERYKDLPRTALLKIQKWVHDSLTR